MTTTTRSPRFDRHVPTAGHDSPRLPLSRSPALQLSVAWLILALLAGLFFALRTSAPGLGSYREVHDDVRQHVFWVPRLHDPTLFRGDLIADYYASQAPPGFVAVYWLGTLFVDPVTFSKLLPLLLTPILTAFGYLLGLRLFRRPAAAGLGAALLAWSTWWYDDVASAAARAFATPLLVAFLAFLVERQWRLTVGTVVLMALFYPLGCATMLATWGLWWFIELRSTSRCSAAGRRRDSRLTLPLSHSPTLPLSPAWLLLAAALAVGLVALDQRDAARFGPLVTGEQARQLPEFQENFRSSYFVADPLKFWLDSTRSGLALKPRDPLLWDLPALTIPFLLTLALVAWRGLARAGMVRRPPIPRRNLLLLALLAASLLLFGAAHALLFRLYLPARHVQFSLPIIWSLAGGLFLALAAERLGPRLAPRRPALARGLLGLGALGLLLLHAPPPGGFYVEGRHTALYAYLRSLPADTLVAALPRDSSILPLFSQRPIFTSFEHALPYHRGYFEPLQRRTRALEQAYFAPTFGPLLELADREGIDVIVANLSALDRWRRDNPGRPLGLIVLIERCAAVRDRELAAIPIDCARALPAAVAAGGGRAEIGSVQLADR